MSELQNIPVQELEQLRPRLTQLTNSLTKLEESLNSLNYNVSRDLKSVKNQFNIIIQQFNSLTKTLQSTRPVLNTRTVFPNNEFDTMNPLLFTLLRKKLTPKVEEWINSAIVASNLPQQQQQSSSTSSSIPQTADTGFLTNAATTQSEPRTNNNDMLNLWESILLKSDKLSELIIEYSNDSIDDFLFAGYLTKDDVDKGLKVSDVLKDIGDDEDDETIAEDGLDENSVLRFIYQGLNPLKT